MRALIASGTGRYEDEWHSFTATSEILSTILTAKGFVVKIDDDVDHAMATLGDVDLLVVNAGDPWSVARDVVVPQASIDGLRDALERGIGVLAMHTALGSLRDYPEWASAIGAMWVPKRSSHPPIGEAEVRGLVMPGGSPVSGFEVFDERYCALQPLGRSEVVAEHDGTSRTEPTAWVRHSGPARIAVDTLGHDVRSYAASGHVALIEQLAEWAVTS